MSVTEERPGAKRAPDAASREPPRPDSSDGWSVGLVGHGIDPSARPSTAGVLPSMAGPMLLKQGDHTHPGWWARWARSRYSRGHVQRERRRIDSGLDGGIAMLSLPARSIEPGHVHPLCSNSQ